MSYEVKIIGSNDSIVIDNDKGMRLSAAYNDDSIPDSKKLDIGGIMYTRKGQIRYVRKVEDSEASNTSKSRVTDDINEAHLKRYRAIAKLTPERKAEQVSLFRECYRATSGAYPSDGTVVAFRRDSAAFFAENPRRTVPDPKCFMDNLTTTGGKSTAARFMLRLLERVVAEDMASAR